MALDLRLQQKMSQQLVMTPQLQQAIKLLQLSHLEMAEVLREEIEQNPVLEDRGDGEPLGDSASEPGDDTGALEAAERLERAESDGDSDNLVSKADAEVVHDVFEAPLDATPEPTNEQVEKEIDWEAYLDTYSYSLPAAAGGGDSDEMPSYEATMTKPTGLADHLRWQVRMADFDERETAISELLIEEINDDGYLANNLEDSIAAQLGVTRDEVEAVIARLQSFDPIGVAARDLRECLLIQLRHDSRENTLVGDIVDRHLPDVERRNYQAIAKTLKVTLEEVGEAIRHIAQLEPRPGRVYTDKEPQYILPDIYVSKVGDEYVIVLNEDGLPRLRISNYYRNALRDSGGSTKSYIQERLRSAAWLIRSIHMRQRTIYRVMESILKFQRDFFDRGVAHLKPLILKDVAEDLGMHESTISRVTTNKYVHTPQGIYELKYFFNSSINRLGARGGKNRSSAAAVEGIASESVRDHIKKLIDEEDPRRPISDQRIVELLKKHDIDIARRTVAKYREMLRIPSSSRRKKVF